ncbi:MAG: tRNA-U20-dihydrouridine synthase [Magnetococcales bacterium]|nr:tRNA-U20-dihydrouridine synthase [Magnetococcales bacterium]HIJ83111.1 tRNA dihydrouridine synthase DusB [Magnetococcales bacterium]
MDAIAELFSRKTQEAPPVPLILAPMAGVTDAPFRSLALRYGARLAFSEMVASQAMVRHTPQSLKIVSTLEPESIFAVQIAGSDPAVMAEAARMNEGLGARVIDINMGCPVKKICNNGAGAALLRNESLAGAIVAQVSRAVQVPVTVKIRLGWDHDHKNGLTIARIAEQNGARLVTVHGRTRADMYHGKADWAAIATIKKALSIPVIGNGDVVDPESAREMLEVTGVDGIMIGRGALGRPWIFTQIAHFLANGTTPSPPDLKTRLDLVANHFQAMIQHLGPVVGNRLARKHLAWHTRGLVGGGRFRNAVNHSPDPQTTAGMIETFFREQPDF